MKEFTVPMALFDFIPVILFFAGSLFIGSFLGKRVKIFDTVFYYIGFILITAAGLMKALYKLFYAADIGDFTWLNDSFFTT